MEAGHDGTWNSVRDSASFPGDTWVHVAVTYDDATDLLTLYRDGAVVAGPTVVAAPVTDATVSIGSFGASNGYWWTGRLDDVQSVSGGVVCGSDRFDCGCRVAMRSSWRLRRRWVRIGSVR